MKNLLKFVVFVCLLSAGVSALYDVRLRQGGLGLLARVAPEKYTLATTPTVDPKNIPTLDALNRERRALVSSVLPSVVSIRASKRLMVRRQLDPFEFFRGGPRQPRGPGDDAQVENSLGSGLIVSKEGHIMTNNHVVDQVDEIEVQLSDGRTRKARLVGADAQADLAVLKIDEPGLKPLPLGDSDAVQAGDFVLAIGNPFGFEETVTDGIISSKGRPNRVDGFGDYLQTNAAINPGNSGGPLINLRGEVIGINTAIISRSGGSQGIGFAIPSNTVRTALESLLREGRIIRGYLGIQTRPMQPGQPSAPSDGVVVERVVAGSPAAAAEIRPGDVIRKFDGKDVKNFPELRSRIAQAELNKKVEVEVDRDGKPVKLIAEIREQPADFLSAQAVPQQPGPGRQLPPQPGAAPDEGDDDNSGGPSSAGAGPLAAVEVRALTPELSRTLGVPDGVRGVVVAKVDPNSGAGELRAGDVIEEINQQPVTSTQDFAKLAASLDANQTAVLSVCRKRTRSFVVVRPG